MHKLIAFCALFAIALAQTPAPLPVGAPFAGLPQRPYYPQIAPHIPPQNYRHPYVGAEIPILRQTQDLDAATGYHWSFSSGNGINAEESATIIPVGPELADKQVRGSYDYVSIEGIPISVTYYSDSTGFHPHVHVGHAGQPHIAKP